MKVITVHPRLRISILLVTLCVPLVALETILISKAPWWNLPLRSIQIWMGAFALLSFPLVFWMSQGRRWAFEVTQVFAVIWCAVSVWIAVQTQNFWLGFFCLFLIFFWILVLSSIKNEISRSFFDPRMSWFQGLPRPIPEINCEVLVDQDRVQAIRNFRVCRLDRDGTFIYVDRKPKGLRVYPTRSKDRVDLKLSFRGQQIQCRAMPVRLLDSGNGLGLKFTEMSADAQKRLGDFVENLRGEGYVE